MTRRTSLLLAAGAGAAVLTAAMILHVRWLVDFALNWSDDLILNSLHMAGLTAVLGLASVLEGLLVREAWHRLRPEEELEGLDREERKREVQRKIRETKILWTVFIGVPLVVNVLVINAASGGYVLSGQGGLTRFASVATMLRSDDPDVQARGIDESVGLTERKLGRYLSSIIAGRGRNASFAAWAAATRGDEEAVVPLRWLFLKGDPAQRQFAVISLARLGDRRGAELAHAALRAGETPQLECIIAVGLAGFDPAEPLLVEIGGDASRPEILRAAAFWAISEIEKDRFRRAYEEQKAPDLTPETMKVPERRGYEPMLAALGGDSPVLMCAAVQALRYAGPVDTTGTLMALFERSGHLDKCQRLRVDHFEATSFEIVRFGLVRSQIIDTLAGIGDRSVAGWLERQAEDRENADEVILKARDLARQIRSLR
jgi:hypothetical protein